MIKNNRSKKVIALLLTLIVLTTGCTKYLQGNDKRRITNEVTGQAITSNILCLPKSEELLNIYETNKDNLDVDYNKLKPCEKFSLSDVKYNSLWETLFVKPLAWCIIKVGNFVHNYGIAVMILGILIRLVLYPLTKKSLSTSENMKKAQPELQAIQKKYNNSTNDKLQATMMTQELMQVYKKYGINPASGCLVAFIQLPILLAFLEAINRVPAIFEGYLLTMQLGTSPYVGIKNGNLLYIVLIVLIIVTTYFSYKNSMNGTGGTGAPESQMNSMMKFMVVFIAIASLTLPTALALYWIVSNGSMIIQNIIIKKSLESNKSTGKVIKNKNKKRK